jgi:hypothetical protein
MLKMLGLKTKAIARIQESAQHERIERELKLFVSSADEKV